MRLLLAALFVVGCLLLAIGLLSDVIENVPYIVAEIGMAVLFLVLCAVALVLFNDPFKAPGDRLAFEKQLKELDEKGMLVSTDFKAVRSFGVEELEDEGPHYFIELEGGTVLYLNGQYLDEYEPDDYDPKHNRARRFPCTDFTLRQIRNDGGVADIICRGHVLEPESMEPAFWPEDYLSGITPEDGDMILNQTYDELRNMHGRKRSQ